MVGADPLLVALDFDGTLAPLQDDPQDSRALPEGVRALRALAACPAVRLALISGRGLADLSPLAEVPEGTWLIGSHGAELGRRTAGGGLEVAEGVDPAGRARLDEAAARLEPLTGDGAWIERKPAATVFHTRLVSDRQEAARRHAAAIDIGRAMGMEILEGKNVAELGISSVTKADAIGRLRTLLAPERIFYAGDDTTDENAFAALSPGDVAVKVGPGRTAARWRVADPAALCALLGRLAALLG
ncbi:MAG: trehalose-phosphatase [Bifidobacteriaceae bacterium]|nr:trehalose-phosphatase [Bifidobacteriaceae bacterium]